MKKVFLVLAFGQTMALSAQQFSGNSNVVDPISRIGNVSIGAVGTGTPSAKLHLTASTAGIPTLRVSTIVNGSIPAFNWDVTPSTTTLNGSNQYRLDFTLSGVGQPFTPLTLRSDGVVFSGNTLANRVGIGTVAPTGNTKLAVMGDVKMGSTLIGTTAATVPFRIVADNTVADMNPYIEMYSNNSTVANTKGNIHFITNSSSGNKGQYRFGTQNGSTWTTMMVVDANGKIVMGISDPNKEAQVIGSTETYKLYLGGGLRTEKVRVDLQSSWADYAFEDNYNLMSLADLEAYIEANKHLPNVPAAAEVEKEGIDVSEMLKIQMEKTEELTLYILQLNERIKSLESVIANQTSK